MALVVADRVKETTTTTGTGAITLAGAEVNFVTFSSVLSDGDTTYYAIVDDANQDFEVGLGTYATSGNTLTRTTVLASSNGGSAVDLSANSKEVFINYPAGKSVYLNGSGQLVIGGTAVTATAAELNFVDGVTSNIQTQLDSIDPVKATQTKTYTNGETSTITLSSAITSGVPVISVTKEVPQTGVTNNTWDVDSTAENYTRYNTAPATTLSWVGFDVSISSFVDSFSVSSEDANSYGLAFSTDGTKMFVTGQSGDSVYQYTLSSGFDVSTASYDSVSFSVAAQETNPTGIAFNTDGTKMYIVGGGQDINEYTLSTAFDISTSTYSQNFSVASQETSPSGITFNADGTKMFIVGYNGDEVNEYTLSTGFDVSTASFVDAFSVASQDTTPRDIAFNTDGTRMFIVGSSNDSIYEYALSTGFDVSTASFTDSFSVSAQDSNPLAIAFNAGGSKMLILGGTNDSVFEYDQALLTLGTGSFASADVGKTIEANGGTFILTSTAGAYTQTSAPTSYDQVASGSWEMYGVVYNTTDGDLELSSLFVGFDLSTASYSQSLLVTSQDADPFGIAFNTDGTKMFLTGDAANEVNEFTLSTAFDVSTASFSQNFSVSSQVTRPTGLAFNSSGDKMFVVGTSGDAVYEYSLSTGFDVSTASYSQNFSVSAQEATPEGIAFNTDGTKMFIVGLQGVDVNEYDLSTGFDVSTASYSQNFDVSSEETSPKGIAFNTDGTKMFIVGDTGDEINEYTLGTGFDVSTASYSQNFSVSAQDTSPQDIAFNTDGTKMFIVGDTGNSVYEYSIGTTAILTGYHAAHTTTSTDSTYWIDINSMTADEAAGDGNVYYAVSTDDRTTWKIAKSTDGERSIVRNNSGTWQYNSNTTYGSETWVNATTNAELPALQEAMAQETGFLVSNASYDSVSFSVAGQTDSIFSLAFNADGTKMFVLDQSVDDITYYSLSTGFDLSSTVTHLGQYSVAAQETSPNGLTFNPDGTKMFIVGGNGRDITYYSLSTGFDLTSTVTHLGQYSISAQTSYPREMAFNTDGTKMFVVDSTNIHYYTLSTGFDLSSPVTYVSAYSVSANMTAPIAIRFSPDGTQMFLVDYSPDDVTYYSLSTPFDLSSGVSYVGEFSVASQTTSPGSFAFSADGTKMFILDNQNNNVFQYSTAGLIAIAANQMDKTQLDAVPDANHFTLGDDLDLAVIFNMSSGTTAPSSDGVSINYDANALNQGAVLGTDYNWDFPATDKVRITSLAAQNLKTRII